MGKETFQLIDIISARDVFGEKLIEVGKKDERIVAVTADLGRSNRSQSFFKEFPDRFFNVGIAEADMMAIGAGLALEGKLPFVSSMATFASMRALEQIRTDICYNNLPVKIVATHSGFSAGAGATHASSEDLGIMRSLPNMTVVVPGDPNQIGKVIDASLEVEGPIFIRIGRGGEPVVYKDNYEYVIGKAITVREGNSLALIACGPMVWHAVQAAEELSKDGISARVIDMHTLKPLDREAVLKAASEIGVIITTEDHNIINGLGTAVADVIAEEGMAIKFKKLGIPDVYAPVGGPEELYHKYGYDTEGIVNAARKILN